MKRSELKQLIKEELLKELGFDYPGKNTNAPSQYQNGIIDTLYHDDMNPINEASTTIGPGKNLKLKTTSRGVEITREGINGLPVEYITIFKSELVDFKNFLNGIK